MRHVFGEWDAPVTDDATPIDTPVGDPCVWCMEKIQPGDDGGIDFGGHAVHKECSLRNVLGGIGHHVNHPRYCNSAGLGPDAGLSRRLSAILVWQGHTRGMWPTEKQLDQWRESGATTL